MKLKQIYKEFIDRNNIYINDDMSSVSIQIGSILNDFIGKCNNPAIWCNGVHTKMLMAEYMYLLKKLDYIIDRADIGEKSGFTIITDNQINDCQIDGIIISSFKYRKDIAEIIKNKYPSVAILDIYEELSNVGIDLDAEYYTVNHPYWNYLRINQIKAKIRDYTYHSIINDLYSELLKIYFSIKDFRSAAECMKEYLKISNTSENRRLLTDIEQLYNEEISAAARISERNVLMLCFDGLRRADIDDGLMPKVKSYIDTNMMYYDNAYSVSTSTFESLIPVYSNNSNMKTKYYEKNTISEDECKFITEAKAQNREIYFFTDTEQYVECEQIHLSHKVQSASEKIWEFINLAEETDNGLFYVHILYESHFSYPNIYTNEPIIVEGTNILFDFLSQNGSKIRTDYNTQHKDSLRYLDDIVYPIMKELRCSIVMYADHGNVIYDRNQKAEEIKYSELTFDEKLIAVPLAIKSPKTNIGKDNTLCSLMELNSIVLSLLRNTAVTVNRKEYIKIQRTALYNRDFNYLYKKFGYERGLLAFEGFIFIYGYKLIIYSDGVRELYYNETDEIIQNDTLEDSLLEKVKGDITVY